MRRGAEVERALPALEPRESIERDIVRQEPSAPAAETGPRAVSAYEITGLASEVHAVMRKTNSFDGWRRWIVSAIAGDRVARATLFTLPEPVGAHARELIARADYERTVARSAPAGEPQSSGVRIAAVRGHSSTVRPSVIASELR